MNFAHHQSPKNNKDRIIFREKKQFSVQESS